MFDIIRLKEKGFRKVLGPLEAEIMELTWGSGNMTVNEVHLALSKKREIAYTTVMTVMDRLYKKDLLKRTKKRASYVYQPVLTRDKFQESLMEKVVKFFLADFEEPAVSYFIKLVESHPSQMSKLRGLMKHIKQLKRE